jgi:hypothetical protein
LAGCEGSLDAGCEEERGGKNRECIEGRRVVDGAGMARADESASRVAASALFFERFLERRQGHSLGPVGRIVGR